MHSVKIKVDKLLEHLEKNREQHIKDYEEAMLGYRNALAKELSDKLSVALSGRDVEHTIKTVRPTSYLSSYDDIISRLNWTEDDIIELDNSEFKQYVSDEWSWQTSFSTTTAIYKSK